MYGKIFDSIYDGTLCGHWEAIVTMQQLIVLADADGMVDMTPQAIAARTSIPLDIITKGLKLLGEPDPYSRTPGEEGRRIELIDGHRPWGWHLVNHEKYKHLQDADTVRAQNRERAQRHRDRNKAPELVTVRNAASRGVTPSNAESRHTDTDTDTKTPLPPSGAFLKFWGAWPKHHRKQAQGRCWEVWRKADLDLVVEKIIAHVEALKSGAWRKDAGAYIPAPKVYLNDRRWEGAELFEKPEKEMVM